MKATEAIEAQPCVCVGIPSSCPLDVTSQQHHMGWLLCGPNNNRPICRDLPWSCGVCVSSNGKAKALLTVLLLESRRQALFSSI